MRQPLAPAAASRPGRAAAAGTCPGSRGPEPRQVQGPEAEESPARRPRGGERRGGGRRRAGAGGSGCLCVRQLDSSLLLCLALDALLLAALRQSRLPGRLLLLLLQATPAQPLAHTHPSCLEGEEGTAEIPYPPPPNTHTPPCLHLLPHPPLGPPAGPLHLNSGLETAEKRPLAPFRCPAFVCQDPRCSYC